MAYTALTVTHTTRQPGPHGPLTSSHIPAYPQYGPDYNTVFDAAFYVAREAHVDKTNG